MSHSVSIFKRKGGVKYREDTIACSCVARPGRGEPKGPKTMGLTPWSGGNYQPVGARNLSQWVKCMLAIKVEMYVCVKCQLISVTHTNAAPQYGEGLRCHFSGLPINIQVSLRTLQGHILVQWPATYLYFVVQQWPVKAATVIPRYSSHSTSNFLCFL